jgi:hypothetical protein
MFNRKEAINCLEYAMKYFAQELRYEKAQELKNIKTILEMEENEYYEGED